MDKNEKLNKVASGLRGQNGCFLIGKIEGVDFTASGKLENGQTYGSSIKLKFAQKQEVVKKVNGIDVATITYRASIVKIAVDDSQLANKVQEFNQKIGKEVIIELELNDNSSFKSKEVLELAS